MLTNNLIYLLPIASVVVFSLMEKFLFNQQGVSKKTQPIALITLMNLIVSLGFSAVILIPFIMLVAPLQMFSFAQQDIPGFVKVTLSLIAIDFIYYISHRLHHAIPLLWRLHRLHHSDTFINAQTTLLHHPLELVSTNLLIILGAIILDVPANAFIYYSVIIGLHSVFTHTHITLTPKIEKWVDKFFITPNYHRRHHAKALNISNTNFGMVFIYWDCLFNTALFQDDQDSVLYGIDLQETPKKINLWHFLVNPFKTSN